MLRGDRIAKDEYISHAETKTLTGACRHLEPQNQNSAPSKLKSLILSPAPNELAIKKSSLPPTG